VVNLGTVRDDLTEVVHTALEPSSCRSGSGNLGGPL
jgi:hypothetical protein